MVSTVASLVACLLGLVSAFSIFALAFNGYGWEHFAVIAVMITMMSALAGRFLDAWKGALLVFFVPYLFLFAMFIMAGIEKGGWQMIIPIILSLSAVIWFPAFLVSKWMSK